MAFEVLAEHYRDEPSVTIAKMQADENRVADLKTAPGAFRKHPLMYLPNALLFPPPSCDNRALRVVYRYELENAHEIDVRELVAYVEMARGKLELVKGGDGVYPFATGKDVRVDEGAYMR